MKRKLLSFAIIIALTLGITGCGAGLESSINDLKGSITGNTYECQFYSNTGKLTMRASGTNIGLSENIIRESTYNSEDGWGYTESLSSVITISIDGHQIETCGDTVLFIESGLKPDVNFNDMDTYVDIVSQYDNMTDMPFFTETINLYKNYFGKPVVAVIKSQLGEPIVAYSGNNVYWEVREDLPKTTKLYIDGKALYIHRANFQIIDTALFN